MPTRRQERVNARLVVEVSGALRTLRDPRVGFVTITEADVAPDLSTAKIYFSVYGDAEAAEKTTQALRAAASYIRRTIAHHFDMRIMPFLQFVFDTRIAHADEMSRLIAQARATDPNPGPAAARPAPVEEKDAETQTEAEDDK